MPIDPLAAFALTLAFCAGSVAYVLRMADMEARRRGKVPNRRVP